MSKLLILGSIAFDQIETPFGKSNSIMGGSANYIALLFPKGVSIWSKAMLPRISSLLIYFR